MGLRRSEYRDGSRFSHFLFGSAGWQQKSSLLLPFDQRISLQIQLAIKLIKRVIEGKIKSFEIKEEATNKYNEWLQDRLADSVWNDCNSYYQARTGGEKRGKIIATFPGPVSLFWWLTKFPRWKNWIMSQ